jgi:hypothetical protein
VGCIVEFDLFAEWDQDPPEYRLFVNDTLVAERTYVWKDHQYLHEIIPLSVTGGTYTIKLQQLDDNGKLTIRNTMASKGPVKILNDTTFEVHHAG